MTSNAKTVQEYLDQLPKDRREHIETVRNTILKYLPNGYEEGMQYGMIGYYIPLEDYPETYNGHPLGMIQLASQKNHMALYLMCAYSDPNTLEKLQNGFKDAGHKLNMGKSCIRFKSSDNLPLDVIGEIIADTTPDKFIAIYEDARAMTKKGK